jgi:hypothetical protein
MFSVAAAKFSQIRRAQMPTTALLALIAPMAGGFL